MKYLAVFPFIKSYEENEEKGEAKPKAVEFMVNSGWYFWAIHDYIYYD